MIQDLTVARRWLARDHLHNHPTSIVEIRGKATTPAIFYLVPSAPLFLTQQDWDHVGQGLSV